MAWVTDILMSLLHRFIIPDERVGKLFNTGRFQGFTLSKLVTPHLLKD